MSLLDALQSAGAIDKKAVALAKREAKRARKKERGSLEKKKVIEARADEEQSELLRQQLDKRSTERIARNAVSSKEESKVTASNLIRAWSISFSVTFSTTSFSFENNSGETETIRLPEFLVKRVRSGVLGLARIGADGDAAVLPKGALVKLHEALPSAILFVANDPEWRS
jgi:uncharacterized protein YaiL (DUF2058 family)